MLSTFAKKGLGQNEGSKKYDATLGLSYKKQLNQHKYKHLFDEVKSWFKVFKS